MLRREWKKIAVALLLIVLFVLVALTIFKFQKESEDVFEDYTNNPSEEIVFQNSSDMSEQEIRQLVEEKRNTLKSFFENAKYYNISEVSSEYTKEDDEKYIVIDENFLNQFHTYVTDDVYGYYWDQLTEITPDQDVLLTSRIHRGPKTMFDSVYSDSAIAMINVNEEILELESATNEKIVSIINIRLCPDGEDAICSRNDHYRLILEKVENDWKIALLFTAMQRNK